MFVGLDPSLKQLESFREANARINIWVGAVRSGKTYISLWRFLTELFEGPKGEYALITRTFSSFERNILPLLEKMIGIKNVAWKSGHARMYIGGNTIHVIGADDGRAEAKIRGPTFSGAYVDEITIIPEAVFLMLISRCAMGGAKIFGTTNPDSPFHWLKTGFLEGNEDVKFWNFDLNDNPSISREDREYLKRQYKGLWYKRFIEGDWVQAQGSVYDSFDPHYHVIPHVPSYTAPVIIGIDYGTTNPCAFVSVRHSNSHFPRFAVESEYYYDSRVSQRQKTDSEYAEDFIKFIEDKPVEAIYIDPSAISFKMELMKRGVQKIFVANNEVLDGIRFVAKLMTDGALKISQNCPQLIKELQSYVWDEKAALRGEDKPRKENDHALDALRYCLFTHLFTHPDQRLTERDLEQMYNESRGMNANLPNFFQDY